MRNKNEIRDWLFAFAAMAIVFGVGALLWQTILRVHVQPANSVSLSSTSHASPGPTNAIPSAVDPGAPLSGKMAPNFQLTNQFGQRGTLAQFRGHVVILSFIDSKCTTVCPLTAVVLQNVRYDLGKYASHVQFVAVNANPVATSVRDVYDWSKQHHVLHMWDYFTGSASQLKSVYRNYAVETTVLHGTNVQHTPAVYVIGPTGKERWVYLNAPQSSTSVLGAEVHDILAQVVPILPGHPKIKIPPLRELAFLPGAFGPQNTGNLSFELPAVVATGQMTSVQVGNGQGPTLLDFFATWCPDCEEEMPALAKLQNWSANHSAFPHVVAVDLELSEPSVAHVKSYAARLRLPFPVALDHNDKVSDMYDVNGIPTQVLVSSSGRILWYHQGLIGWNDLKSQLMQSLQGAKTK